MVAQLEQAREKVIPFCPTISPLVLTVYLGARVRSSVIVAVYRVCWKAQ